MKFLTLGLLLLVINANAQSDKYCKKIKKEIDDFTGEVKFSSPYTIAQYPELVRAVKIVENDTANYYIGLNAYGRTSSVGEKGVIILMDDGSKIEFPDAEIDIDVYSADIYRYSCFVALNADHLKKLSESTINKYRLYIYDKEIKRKYKIKYQEYFKCIQVAE